MDTLDDFTYDIPQELIAQRPLTKRDQSRLMIINKNDEQIEHKQFFNIADYLKKGDLLVFNNTKVLPARLFGHKKTGGLVEILLLNETKPNEWKVLLKTGSKPKPLDRIEFDKGVFGTVIDDVKNGQSSLSFSYETEEFRSQQEFMQILEKIGRPPLPPYIKRKKISDNKDTLDRDQYQTVYAEKKGAIAAPTAGLHFTRELLEKIKKIGVETTFVTLHVGIGTFKPIKTDDFREHNMHSEYFEIPEIAAMAIANAKTEKRRVICVGTTSCRVVESAGKDGTVKQSSGWTNLFIYPPYEFKMTDALITNFHQSRTTLLLLVSAFTGTEKIQNSYKTAIEQKYRFHSYGDSMFIC